MRTSQTLRRVLGVAILGVLSAAVVSEALAHCKPPPIRVEIITPMEFAEPPDWSWMYWWEANRDVYLNQLRQDHRFQEADEEFVAGLRSDAVELLLEALDHEQPTVRAEAALALGRMQEETALERLQELAKSDRSESVRRHALLALGTLDADGTSEFLQELDYPTEGLQEAALLSLGLLSELDDNLRESLRRHVRQTRPSLAYASSWVLQQHAGSEEADFYIRQVERSESPWLVSDAILALGTVNVPEGNRMLAAIAAGDEKIDALPAWRMLDQVARAKAHLLGPRERFAPRRDVEEEDVPAVQRRLAREALAEARREYLNIHDRLRDHHPSPVEQRGLGPMNSKELVLGIEQTHEARLRVSAAIALGETGHRNAALPLLEMLSQRETPFTSLPQRFALISLGRLGDPRSLERILLELDIRDDRGLRKPIGDTASKRGFAAIAAGLYARPVVDEEGDTSDREGTAAALEMLASRLHDPREDLEVRTACAVALGLTRRTEVLPALQRLELDPRQDDLLIGYVLLARGMLSDRNILQPAERFLSFENNRTGQAGVLARRAAAMGLGMLGSTEGIPTLDKAWDLGYDVSREVIRALALCDAQNVAEMAMGHYSDPENYIEQAYMCRALGELFEVRRPSTLAQFSVGSNVTVDNIRMLPYRTQANEFLYTYLIPSFEGRQDISLDWGRE